MTLKYKPVREKIKNLEIIDECIVTSILQEVMVILSFEPNLLELNPPVIIVGDIHGQLTDLFSLFSSSGGVDDDLEINGKYKYLFMGDYVDRGYYSLNTFLFLACLKIDYPDHIYLLRGNHESRGPSSLYGFSNEVLVTYGHLGLWELCIEAFRTLPIAAVTTITDPEIFRVFSVHGGLTPKIPFLEQINRHNRYEDYDLDDSLNDLFWSDPEPSSDTWQLNSRGAGYLFGRKQLDEFCNRNNIDLVTRSHQMAMQGYDIPLGEGSRLITVWSAPNYGYRAGCEASVFKIDGHIDINDLSKNIFKFKQGDHTPPDFVKSPTAYFG